MKKIILSKKVKTLTQTRTAFEDFMFTANDTLACLEDIEITHTESYAALEALEEADKPLQKPKQGNCSLVITNNHEYEDTAEDGKSAHSGFTV